MMDILYLDLDGVLHPHDVHAYSDGSVILGPAGQGHRLFEHAQLLADILREHPQVRIVLSSSWVPSRGLAETVRMLPPELSERIIGATFDPLTMVHEAWASVARGYQIQADVQRRRPARWVALDDDVADWPEEDRGHLVRADAIHGLARKGALAELRAHLDSWKATLGRSPTQPTLLLDLDDILVLNVLGGYGGYDVIAPQRPPDLWQRLVHAPSREVLLQVLTHWKPRVVLTTSWTRFMPREMFVEVFNATGLELLTASLHPAWEAPPMGGNATRRDAIDSWLSQHHAGEPYCILDDPLSGTGLAGSVHDLESRVVFCQVGVGLHRGHLMALGHALSAAP